MSDFQAIADRIEIEALRGEFTDAAMMRDRARLASLFTPDGALRMPNIPVELVGREDIRAGGEALQAQWEFFVQTTHPGTIRLDGDTATGRAYIQELARTRDGRQGLNYAIYHDRYQRTGDGWKFTERVYEVRYLDTTPLAGSAPCAAERPAREAATTFAGPASAQRLERAAAALTAHGFTAEILDDAAAARTRVKDLIPEGASVFTAASETLRLSGIDEDINASGRYQAVKPRALAMDRAAEADDFRRLLATPDVVVGSVAALTETGSAGGRLGQRQPAARLRRRRRPRGSGSPGRRRWCPTWTPRCAASKTTACPLESARTQAAYGLAQRRQPPAHPQRRTPPRAQHRPAAPRSHRVLKPGIRRGRSGRGS